MGRYSPPPEAWHNPFADAIEGIGSDVANAIIERKQAQQREKDQNRAQSIQDWELEREINSDPRYTTEQPETPAPTTPPPVLQGGRLGLQAGASRYRTAPAPMLAQPGPHDLASSLEASAGPPDVSSPLYHPGEYVPETGSYTPRAVFADARPSPLAYNGPELPPEKAAPVTTVAGINVYANPDYRSPSQQLARNLELVSRARGGDQGAADELMATNPALYKEYAATANTPTVSGMVAAGVPQAAAELARNDPALARELIYAHNRPTPAGTEPVKYTAADLQEAGVPKKFIAAAVKDPVLARSLVAQYAKPANAADLGVQDAITRRQLTIDALQAVGRVETYYDPEKDPAAYNAAVKRAIKPYGYDNIIQLQQDAQALRTRRPTRTRAGGDEAGTRPARPTREQIAARATALWKEHPDWTRDQVKAQLAKEHLISGTGQ